MTQNDGLYYLMQAAKTGYAPAHKALGDWYVYQAKYETACMHYVKAIEYGYPDPSNIEIKDKDHFGENGSKLSDLLLSQSEVQSDVDLAITFLRYAARLGHPIAASRFDSYLRDNERDHDLARQLFQKTRRNLKESTSLGNGQLTTTLYASQATSIPPTIAAFSYHSQSIPEQQHSVIPTLPPTHPLFPALPVQNYKAPIKFCLHFNGQMKTFNEVVTNLPLFFSDKCGISLQQYKVCSLGIGGKEIDNVADFHKVAAAGKAIVVLPRES